MPVSGRFFTESRRLRSPAASGRNSISCCTIAPNRSGRGVHERQPGHQQSPSAPLEKHGESRDRSSKFAPQHTSSLSNGLRRSGVRDRRSRSTESSSPQRNRQPVEVRRRSSKPARCVRRSPREAGVLKRARLSSIFFSTESEPHDDTAHSVSLQLFLAGVFFEIFTRQPSESRVTFSCAININTTLPPHDQNLRCFRQ